MKQFAYEVRDQILEPLLPGHPSLRLADAPFILRQAMANRANVYDGNQMVLYCQNPVITCCFISRPLVSSARWTWGCSACLPKTS